MSRRKCLTIKEAIALLDELPSDNSDTPIEDDSDDCESDNEESINADTSAPSNMADLCYESSDDENDSQVQRQWKKIDTPTVIPLFTFKSGFVENYFQNAVTPTDFFLTFFDSNIIENIIFQSNLYIVQKQKIIAPVTESEFYGFLGLQFLFSYHRLPHVRQYWSSDSDISVNIVPQTMTRNRYFQILAHVHVNDNSAFPKENKDKLFKLRPLIKNLNENFQKFNLPSQYQSIDESMVLFKGRSSLKQYNPMKPIKRGYKIWCRADMSGYIYEYDVYQGKQNDDVNDSNTFKKKFGLGGSVVIKMTKSLAGGNHIIAMDNFFTSVNLFEYLKSQNIYGVGTIRPNRCGLPQLIDDKMLKRGNFDYRRTDQEISYFKWRDNRSVHFISNYHGNDTCTVSRTNKDGSKSDIPAPLIVRDYNAYMGGVDKANMLRCYYSSDRKAKKWWHRLFFAMIEITLINSYVAYTEMRERVSILQYKRTVAQGLLTKAKCPPKKRGRPKSTDTDSAENAESLQNNIKRKKRGFSVSSDIRLQNRGCHWPEFVQNRGRCELCARNKIQSKPALKCSTCKVFLCMNEKKNCFFEYHHC